MLYVCGITYAHAAAPPASRAVQKSIICGEAVSGQAPHPLVFATCLALMQVCKAQTLYMCGEAYRHAAALLVSEVLHRDPAHEGALLEYVRIVLDRGHTADAVRLLLRLLVNSRERTTVRQGDHSLPSVSLDWRVAISVNMLDRGHTAEQSALCSELRRSAIIESVAGDLQAWLLMYSHCGLQCSLLLQSALCAVQRHVWGLPQGGWHGGAGVP